MDRYDKRPIAKPIYLPIRIRKIIKVIGAFFGGGLFIGLILIVSGEFFKDKIWPSIYQPKIDVFVFCNVGGANIVIDGEQTCLTDRNALTLVGEFAPGLYALEVFKEDHYTYRTHLNLEADRECPEFCVSDRFTIVRSFPRT